MDSNIYLINQRPVGQRLLYVPFATGYTKVARMRWEQIKKTNEGEADAHPDVLAEQIKWATSISLEPGMSPALINTMNRVEGWREHFVNKYVFAYSAGVSCLAMQSFNIDQFRIIQGLGYLPYQTIVHFQPHMEWMVDKLKEVSPEIPILRVDEKPMSYAKGVLYGNTNG